MLELCRCPNIYGPDCISGLGMGIVKVLTVLLLLSILLIDPVL